VRSTVACGAVLILAGAGIFGWQRSQIVHLRAQVARQGNALDELSLRLDGASQGMTVAPVASRAPNPGQPTRGSPDAGAEMRADERRIVLDQYQDVLAQMNLPPETAARLLDLLTDRVETFLDAQDAALRVGFAEGSAQTARAVGLAVAEVDREIVALVGQDGIRRIDGDPVARPPEPAAAPEPAAPVYVTVVVQAPAPAVAYEDSAPQVPNTDADAQYSSYPYPYFPLYPIAAVLNGPRGQRRFADPRNGDEPRRRESVRYTYR